MGIEIAALLISGIAGILSVESMRRAKKATDNQIETNKRLVELEEIHAKVSQAQLNEIETKEKLKGKADVHADLIELNGGYRLRVTNDGAGSAHSIRITTEDDGLLATNDLHNKTPYPTLGPGKNFDIVAVPSMQSVFSITLTWEHDIGGMGRRELTDQKLDVIHLNGCVTDDPENVVFSRSQYASRVGVDAFYSQFAADSITRPIVYIGSTLDHLMM